MVARVAGLLALLLSVLAVAWSPPLDDFWLTLASGRELLAGADPGRALPFTHTPMVDGAINPQWGAQLLFAIGGFVGVALALHVALVAGGLLLTFRRALARSAVTGAVLAMLAALVVLGPHLVPRVQSFSILFFPLALLLLERSPRRWWLPIGYGGLVLAWANVHGAFVLGQLLPLGFLAGSLLTAVRARTFGAVLSENRMLVITAVVALTVPLLNPAGLALYLYAYGQAGNEAVRSLSTEWQPAWPWTPFGATYWAFALVVLAGRPWRHELRPDELLVLGATFLLGLIAIRSIPWFVLAATPLLAQQIGRWLEHPGPMSRAIGRLAVTRGRALAIASTMALAAVLLQLVRPGLPDAVARVTPTMPVALVDELARRLPADSFREPIFNEQGWGGYIAYRLGDRVATYVDGRIETPTIETWTSYLRLMNADPEAAQSLAETGVKWAIIEPQPALREALEANRWGVVLATPEGVLLKSPD